MTSATDELRRLLDERGVEHYDGTESTLWLKDEHGYRASADELTSGRLSVHVWCDTPEQAIAATLVSGTSSSESANPQVRCTNSKRNAPGQSREDSHTLLPCPFCGGEAEAHEFTFPYHYWDVWCDGECFDHFCEMPTEAKAIAAWNTRATLGSEREKALEELVQDWQVLYEDPDYGDCIRLRKRMQELGIEVIDE